MDKIPWVRLKNLGEHQNKAGRRTNPEKFLSRSSKGFAIWEKDEIIINLPKGEVIKCGDLKCEHLNKKGKPIESFWRGDLPNSKLYPIVAKATEALGLTMGFAGEVAHSGWPVTLNDWSHPGQRKFTDDEISSAIYNFANKVINPKGVDRKGQFISSSFAEALSERDNPNFKKMSLLELFDEIFK